MLAETMSAKTTADFDQLADRGRLLLSKNALYGQSDVAASQERLSVHWRSGARMERGRSIGRSENVSSTLGKTLMIGS